MEREFNIPLGGSVITWAFVGDLMISFTRDGVIDDDRWDAYMNAIQSKGVNRVLGLGVGATKINSVQRRNVSQAMKGKRIAVVIDHTLTRGIITALGWLGLDIRSYAWSDLPMAIEYVGPGDASIDDVAEVCERLRERSLLAEQGGIAATGS